MATLDKSKPYGEVFGGHAARFEQDGKLFDAAGNEIKPAAPEQPAADKPQAEAPDETHQVVDTTQAAEQTETPPAEPIKRRGGRRAK